MKPAQRLASLIAVPVARSGAGRGTAADARLDNDVTIPVGHKHAAF